MKMDLTFFCLCLISALTIENVQGIADNYGGSETRKNHLLRRAPVPEYLCDPLEATYCYKEASDAFKPFSSFSNAMQDQIIQLSDVYNSSQIDEAFNKLTQEDINITFAYAISIDGMYIGTDLTGFNQTDACANVEDSITASQACAVRHSSGCTHFGRIMKSFHAFFSQGLDSLCQEGCEGLTERLTLLSDYDREVNELITLAADGSTTMSAIKMFMDFCGINHPIYSLMGGTVADSGSTEGPSLCNFTDVVDQNVGSCSVLASFKDSYMQALQICKQLDTHIGGQQSDTSSWCDGKVDGVVSTTNGKATKTMGWWYIDIQAMLDTIPQEDDTDSSSTVNGEQQENGSGGKDDGTESEKGSDTDDGKEPETGSGNSLSGSSTVRRRPRPGKGTNSAGNKPNRNSNRGNNRKVNKPRPNGPRPGGKKPQNENSGAKEKENVQANLAKECITKHKETLKLYSMVMETSGVSRPRQPSGKNNNSKQKNPRVRKQNPNPQRPDGNNMNEINGDEQGSSSTEDEAIIPILDANDPCRKILGEIWDYYSVAPASTTPQTTFPQTSPSFTSGSTDDPIGSTPTTTTAPVTKPTPKATTGAPYTSVDECARGSDRWSEFRSCHRQLIKDLERSSESNAGCDAMQTFAVCRATRFGTCDKLVTREKNLYRKNVEDTSSMTKQKNHCYRRYKMNLWAPELGSQLALKALNDALQDIELDI